MDKNTNQSKPKESNRGKAGKRSKAEHAKDLKDIFHNERISEEFSVQSKKRTFYSRLTRNEEGKIIQSSASSFSKLPSEPDYIKLYLQDVVVLKGLQVSTHSLLHELLKLVKYNTYIFSLSAYDKELITKRLGFKDSQQVANGITKLKKAGIILSVKNDEGKVSRGTFSINAFLFGKGGWAENFNSRNLNKLSILYGCGAREIINESAYLESEEQPIFEEEISEDELLETIKKAQEQLKKIQNKGE